VVCAISSHRFRQKVCEVRLEKAWENRKILRQVQKNEKRCNTLRRFQQNRQQGVDHGHQDLQERIQEEPLPQGQEGCRQVVPEGRREERPAQGQVQEGSSQPEELNHG
jgi:hypothetical protein